MCCRVKRTFAKYICVFILCILIFNLFAVNKSGATEEIEDMQNSMVNFFRSVRSDIDANNLSIDEYAVYGVFISNFFLPGETTVRYIQGDEFAARISEKFFGSSGNMEKVRGINNEVYKSVISGLSGDTYKLYRDKEKHEDLTGSNFLTMFSQEDKSVYTSNGSRIDFNDRVMESVMKVLFAYSPDLIFDKDVGLRSIGTMYIDGYGNIWGRPLGDQESDLDNFVLILPACLNPVVFTRSGSLKFPVSNAFVMGALAKISVGMLNRNDLHAFVPYYNVRDKLSHQDRNNLLNIFGVCSPFRQIGDSDNLFSNAANNLDSVKNFVKDSMTSIDESKSVLLLAVDVNKVGFLEDSVRDINISVEDKQMLVGYFFKSTVLPLSSLADDMYYFKLDSGATYYSGASWRDDDDGLMMQQKLFTDNERANAYANSVAVSPFVNKYFEYIKNYSEGKSNKDNIVMFLEGGNHSEASHIDSIHAKTLNDFVNRGVVPSGDAVASLFEYLIDEDDLIFGFLEPPEENDFLVRKKGFGASFKEIITDVVLNWIGMGKNTSGTLQKRWGKDYVLISYGLSEGDSRIIRLAYAISSDVGSGRFVEEKAGCFYINSSGGSIEFANVDLDQRAFANMLYNFMAYKVFGMNKEVAEQLSGLSPGENIYTDRGNLKTYNTVMNDVNNWPGIYWGYMTEMLNISKDSNGNWSSEPFDNSILPRLDIDTLAGNLDINGILLGNKAVLDSSREKTFEEMQKDIIRKINGLLSTDSNEYRSGILKSALLDWIIATHRDLTGSWLGNVLSVSTGVVSTYASVVGYINTPSLYELPFTAWLLDNYMKLYVFLLLLVAIILIMMFIANVRTLREVVLIFLLMAVALVLPQTLLNNAINISNTANNAIYSGRFNFWAIMQHQQSFSNLASAISGGSSSDYNIALNFEGLKNVYSGDDGVRVKWMTPKKDDVFKATFTASKVSDSLFRNLTVFKWLFSSFVFQEEYIYKDPFVTYLYRPYNAIAQEAREAYEAVYNSGVSKDSVISYIKDKADRQMDNKDYSFNLLDKKYDKVVYAQDQVDLIDLVGPYNREKDDYRYWGIANYLVTDAIFRNIYENDSSSGLDMTLDSGGIDEYARMYLLYTESPFYYFYNVLKHRYGEGVSIHGGSGFSGALLLPDTFVVTDSDSSANGKLRDFLDLEGLFTYVVPYLKAGNNYVYNWTSLHGKNVERYDFGANSSYSPEMYERFKFEQDRKERIQNVWNMYAPWVDSLYDLSVYNKRIGVANKRVSVDDILNPGAYDEVGRSMIWSEADMHAKSYRYSDLSDVEIRIQKVLKSTIKDMMYLVNYYDFSDEVLLTSAAMMATFNFNREFSKVKFLGSGVTLYPQSFELKNFNYDAFLRLVLMNVTGESVMGDTDLYIRVLTKTSWITGLLVIVLDLMAIIAIPALKTVVLLMLLFLGLLMCISCVVSTPERLVKSILDVLITPIILFMVYGVAFAYLVSLFVGEGFTSYVGGRVATITVNDPTVSIVLLIILSGVYIYCLLKLVFMLIRSYKSYGSTTILGVAGLAAGAFAIGQSYLDTGVGKVTRSGKYLGGSIQSKLRHNELVKAMKSSPPGDSGGVRGSDINVKFPEKETGGGAGAGSGAGSGAGDLKKEDERVIRDVNEKAKSFKSSEVDLSKRESSNAVKIRLLKEERLERRGRPGDYVRKKDYTGSGRPVKDSIKTRRTEESGDKIRSRRIKGGTGSRRVLSDISARDRVKLVDWSNKSKKG